MAKFKLNPKTLLPIICNHRLHSMHFHFILCASSYCMVVVNPIDGNQYVANTFSSLSIFVLFIVLTRFSFALSLFWFSRWLHGIALHFTSYDDWLCTRVSRDAFCFFFFSCVSENRHRKIHSIYQTITNERCTTLLQQRKETKPKQKYFIFFPAQPTHVTYGNRYDLHEFHFNFIIYISFRWSVHKVLFYHWILHLILLFLRSNERWFLCLHFSNTLHFYRMKKKKNTENKMPAVRIETCLQVLRSAHLKIISKQFIKKKMKRKRTQKTNDKNRKNCFMFSVESPSSGHF